MCKSLGSVKALCVMLLLAVLATPAHAQQPRGSYTRTEQKRIEEAAQRSIKLLEGYYNLCTDPDGTSLEEIRDAIGAKFTGDKKIFFNDKFEVDDDTDPDNTVYDNHRIPVRLYLQTYKDRVKRTGSEISLENIRISDIYAGQTNNYIRVTYSLKVRATTRDGKPLPDKRRELAEMQIVEEQGGFLALISAIDFATKPVPENEKVVLITGNNSNNTADAPVTMPPAYYEGKLEKGIRYTADNDFVKAYYSLSEAKGPDAAVSAKASDALNKLVSKMQRQGFDNTEDLYSGLMTAGNQLAAKHRYAEATRYYRQALSVLPTKSPEVSTAITTLKAKADAENVWAALIDKGAYEDAKRGLETALQGDPHNVNLIINLARAQAGVGDIRAAESFFNDAAKEDVNNPVIYLWQGKTLLQSKSYGAAYNALVRYKSYAQEETAAGTDSYIAFAKGMMLGANRDYVNALDSLNAAALPEAQVEAANIHIIQGDYSSAEKIVDDLLSADAANADAHYLKGRLKLAAINPGNAARNKEAAMQEYKTAVSYKTRNYAWYYELAELQTGSHLYTDALQTYNRCLENNKNAISVYYSRGKCYYLLNRDEEALADFKTYLAKSGHPAPAFYVDYGRLLTRMSKYDDARATLQQAGEDKEALLALAVLNYVQNPGNTNAYMSLFQRAFVKGVSRESVGADPYIHRLYDSNREFKKMVKDYKYSSIM